MAELPGPNGPKKRTKLGYDRGEVISAMQKEIRKGDEEAAVWWALTIHAFSPEYAWKRVVITAAEDIGFADPEAVGLVNSLYAGWATMKRVPGTYWVSPHNLTMAVMALCRAKKSTEVEDLQSLTQTLQKEAEKKPSLIRPIPEYALDAHTDAGKARGASWDEWYAARHVLFGIPVNQYTEKLWEREPSWRPKELGGGAPQLDLEELLKDSVSDGD